MTENPASPPGCIWMTRPSGSTLLFRNEEIAVTPYTLPDPLIFEDGTSVVSPEQWQYRRKELLALFENLVYGHTPDVPFTLSFAEEEPWTEALEGAALRKQVAITISTSRGSLPFYLLLYIPATATQPVPLFLGYNFTGNHGVDPDPNILIHNPMFQDEEKFPRGSAFGRWPIQQILEAGFGLGTIWYGDIDPDFDDGFQNGLHPLFYRDGQQRPDPDEWGSFGAWAFGLSRALDYLQTEPKINGQQVGVIGASRLGKTAGWTAVKDERFAFAVMVVSGCGGAALSKRVFGEHVHAINDSFPHWFCANFRQFNNNEAALPVDQHELLALIAPRPLYVSSGEEDWWADPRGEFLGTLHASPVYELLGEKGLPFKEFPSVDAVDFSGTLAYHVRTGGHGLNTFDWTQYLAFAREKLA